VIGFALLQAIPAQPGSPPTAPSSGWLADWWAILLVWVLVGIAIAYWLLQFRRTSRRARTIQRFASPVSGSLFALLALIAGAISQFYPDPIKRALPLRLLGDSPPYAALGFGVSVVLMLFLGIAYYAATGHQREEEVRQLQTHTSELLSALRTLPPEGFMRDFPRLCASMLASYSEALVKESSPEELRQAIRIALRTAAIMAQRFDPARTDARYSVNVMRFRSADELGPMHEWSAESRTLYPPGFEYPRIRGALVLDTELATYADSEKAEAIPGLKAIHIAIPEPPLDSVRPGEALGRLRLLPGAAETYLLGNPYFAPDTLAMRTERASYAIDEAVIASADSYFRNGAGKAVRSFVSLPLYADPGVMSGERIGTLNVESSMPKIFRGDPDTVTQFALALAPVHYVVRMLSVKLDEALARQESPPLPAEKAPERETAAAETP
jgi:hypothetical protein